MVKVKESTLWSQEGNIDLEKWLHQLSNKGYLAQIDRIRSACHLSQLAGADQVTETGMPCFQQGLLMADLLADLEVDHETLITALIFEAVQHAELSLDIVEEQLGPAIAKLLKGLQKMSALDYLHLFGKLQHSKQQLDNIRKMLLAMVDDARVVLIKLAERLCILRLSTHQSRETQQEIATEAMEIYAPLANRLGIGAIKWEMEDLAFRYLEPEAYRSIAKGLKSRRVDRDKYVNNIVESLNKKISELGVRHFAIYGRSKHIHSIYRKMKRKNVPLEEIYDATAIRVLVDTEEQCYEVLSIVHALWEQVPAEFDDYIVNPKQNGYQSLHTAVVGPEGRFFEVQIRTFEMHQLAEMGVAAHWKYKEGRTLPQETHERKIEWLRNVLAWHKELATAQMEPRSHKKESTFLEDRIYVFTPDGDVIDLPKGVTPLDFAYHIHSEIGHRCRGAKVNGAIVPLHYTLKTGERVEVLTGKEARPSRDWINPHLNYLKTARAKAKVLHWFKMQDYDRNRDEGQDLLEKELKALGIKVERIQELLGFFNFKRFDDLLAALGRGDLKMGQIISRLGPIPGEAERMLPLVKTPLRKRAVAPTATRVEVEGVGNLLTHMARCCHPLPGDAVIGYVTIGRGVSIHRKDCPNIILSSEKQKQRFLQVDWGLSQRDYLANILIKAFDRTGLLKDITSLLLHEKVHVSALQTESQKADNTVLMTLSLEMTGLNQLARLLNKLQQIPNVIEARRQIQ